MQALARALMSAALPSVVWKHLAAAFLGLQSARGVQDRD